MVCSRCAGYPSSVGTAVTGRCCWLGYRAGPCGGTAATARAGFHRCEAALRGCADAREQRQSVRNTPELWLSGNAVSSVTAVPVHP